MQPTTKFTSVKALPTWAVLLIGFFGIVVGIPIIATVAGAVISLLVTVWACFGAFVASAVACVIAIFISIVMACVGMVQSGWAFVGASLLGAGLMTLLAVGFWYVSVYTTKAVAFIFKKIKGGKRA